MQQNFLVKYQLFALLAANYALCELDYFRGISVIFPYNVDYFSTRSHLGVAAG